MSSLRRFRNWAKLIIIVALAKLRDYYSLESDNHWDINSYERALIMMVKLTIILLFISASLMAQEEIEITGQVTSREGKPQDDVTILVIESKKEIRTDSCGRFKILIPKSRDSFLQISQAATSFHSPKLWPFYFELKKIKFKALNKVIIFKMYYSDKRQVVQKCPTDDQEKVVFKLTKRDKGLPQ